jgi:hypothetical protein
MPPSATCEQRITVRRALAHAVLPLILILSLGFSAAPRSHPVRLAAAVVPTISIRDWAHPAPAIDTSKIYAVVKPGDTLSAMAARVFGSAAAWPALWFQNRAAVPNPDAIVAGQVLMVDAGPAVTPVIRLAAMRALPRPPAPVAPTSVVLSAVHSNVPASPVGSSAVASSGGSTGGWSAYKLCVWSAESGRGTNLQNPTSTASGDFGFLDTTWESVTGLPGSAKNYSLATQSAAFDKLFAESGRSPWITDGC